jgi:hypothetical protein
MQRYEDDSPMRDADHDTPSPPHGSPPSSSFLSASLPVTIPTASPTTSSPGRAALPFPSANRQRSIARSAPAAFNVNNDNSRTGGNSSNSSNSSGGGGPPAGYPRRVSFSSTASPQGSPGSSSVDNHIPSSIHIGRLPPAASFNIPISNSPLVDLDNSHTTPGRHHHNRSVSFSVSVSEPFPSMASPSTATTTPGGGGGTTGLIGGIASPPTHVGPGSDDDDTLLSPISPVTNNNLSSPVAPAAGRSNGSSPSGGSVPSLFTSGAMFASTPQQQRQSNGLSPSNTSATSPVATALSFSSSSPATGGDDATSTGGVGSDSTGSTDSNNGNGRRQSFPRRNSFLSPGPWARQRSRSTTPTRIPTRSPSRERSTSVGSRTDQTTNDDHDDSSGDDHKNDDIDNDDNNEEQEVVDGHDVNDEEMLRITDDIAWILSHGHDTIVTDRHMNIALKTWVGRTFSTDELQLLFRICCSLLPISLIPTSYSERPLPAGHTSSYLSPPMARLFGRSPSPSGSRPHSRTGQLRGSPAVGVLFTPALQRSQSMFAATPMTPAISAVAAGGHGVSGGTAGRHNTSVSSTSSQPSLGTPSPLSVDLFALMCHYIRTYFAVKKSERETKHRRESANIDVSTTDASSDLTPPAEEERTDEETWAVVEGSLRAACVMVMRRAGLDLDVSREEEISQLADSNRKMMASIKRQDERLKFYDDQNREFELKHETQEKEVTTSCHL